MLFRSILPKLLAHASDNTSKPSFDVSHVAQFIEANSVLSMYMVFCNRYDELVGEQLLGTKDFVIALGLVDEPGEYGDREVYLAIENAVRCVRLAFGVLLVGAFLRPLDFFIVNVALPSIQGGLNTSAAELQLVISGYAAAYAVFLITGGRLGDLFGRRRIFLIGSAALGVAVIGGVF